MRENRKPRPTARTRSAAGQRPRDPDAERPAPASARPRGGACPTWYNASTSGGEIRACVGRWIGMDRRHYGLTVGMGRVQHVSPVILRKSPVIPWQPGRPEPQPFRSACVVGRLGAGKPVCKCAPPLSPGPFPGLFCVYSSYARCFECVEWPIVGRGIVRTVGRSVAASYARDISRSYAGVRISKI